MAELFSSQPTWKETFIAFNPTFHPEQAASLRGRIQGLQGNENLSGEREPINKTSL